MTGGRKDREAGWKTCAPKASGGKEWSLCKCSGHRRKQIRSISVARRQQRLSQFNHMSIMGLRIASTATVIMTSEIMKVLQLILWFASKKCVKFRHPPSLKLVGEAPAPPVTTSITTSRLQRVSFRFSSTLTLSTAMGYSRKRKGSDDDGDEVAAKKSKGSGTAPTKHKDDDGNPYWEVSHSLHSTTAVSRLMRC